MNKVLSRRSRLGMGIVLLVAGGVLLFLKQNTIWQQRLQVLYGWPANLIVLGGLLFLMALIFDAPGMVVSGTIVAGVGGILYYQVLSDRWNSWAYLWTLIPGFVGAGLFLRGIFWRADRAYYLRRGINLMVVSAVFLLVFGALTGALNLLGNYGPAAILILLGLYLTARGLWPQEGADEAA